MGDYPPHTGALELRSHIHMRMQNTRNLDGLGVDAIEDAMLLHGKDQDVLGKRRARAPALRIQRQRGKGAIQGAARACPGRCESVPTAQRRSVFR